MNNANSTQHVPRTGLNPGMVSAGWFPDVGIHRRGELYVQGTSRSVHATAAVLWGLAVAVAVSPMQVEAAFFPLKWWLFGGIVWSGMCCYLGPIFRRNWFSNIVIDPAGRLLVYEADGGIITWDSIVEMQICSGRRFNGRHYELNLAWADKFGKVRRVCLHAHVTKWHVLRLARKYEKVFGFKVIDCSESLFDTVGPG